MTQKALNRLGYADDTNTQLVTDGRYTKATRHAVSQFQRNTGYRPTVMLDAKTLSALNAPFRYNGRNHLIGVFGETLYQDDVVPIAERMLSAMPPDTQVEIPYTVSENVKDSDENYVKGDGINLVAMAGPRVSLSIVAVYDDEGNSGILISTAIGGGLGVSASISGIHLKTNAENIYEMTGVSTETGGSLSTPITGPVSIGSEYITGPDYTGYNYNYGLSISPPGLNWPEIHGEVSYAFLIKTEYILLQYYTEAGMTEEATELIRKIQGEQLKKYGK